MKIIKIIPLENIFFGQDQYIMFPGKNSESEDRKFIIYQDGIPVGYISVSDTEIRNMSFRKGLNEKYLLDKTLRILSSSASARRMIRLYVYSDTSHLHQLEKLGFIKRKRFFDAENNKYFKMFKIV